MEPGQLEVPASYEHFEQRADKISQDQFGFDQNIFAQEVEANLLRQRWENFSLEDQKKSLQKYALLFPRSREDAHPQECLRRILELPTGEDVQRALRVRGAFYAQYKADPGEEIYPAVGWLGRYLEYARWNKVPLALHFWAGLAILGAAVRRNYFVDNNVNYIWMNQFVILTGPKGNGKSAARSIAKDVFRRMNQKIANMETEAKRIGRFFSAKAYQVPMLAGDITPEAIVKQLAAQSSTPRHFSASGLDTLPGEAVAIIFCDELSNLLGKATFNAAKRIPLFTELAFEDSYSKRTKVGGLEQIDRMALSILACTQPGWMRNTIVDDALEGGFTERTNFIHRPPSGRVYSMMQIPIIDPLMAEQLADDLVELAMLPGGPQLIQYTPEGAEFFDDWYMREHAKGPRDRGDSSQHSLDRRCIHLLRLATLLCVSERETLPWIQISHIQQALRIIEAEDQYYPAFIAEASEGADAERGREIVAWIASQGGRVRKAQYSQHHKFRGWDKADRDRVMENQLDTGRVVSYQEGGIWYALPGSQPKG